MNTPDRIRQIKVAVAEQFGITVEDIDGRRRPDYIAFPRQVAMSFCVHFLRLKLRHTGEVFGGRHHTDVINAVRRVAERAHLYPAEREAVHAVREKLKSLTL